MGFFNTLLHSPLVLLFQLVLLSLLWYFLTKLIYFKFLLINLIFVPLLFSIAYIVINKFIPEFDLNNISVYLYLSQRFGSVFPGLIYRSNKLLIIVNFVSLLIAVIWVYFYRTFVHKIQDWWFSHRKKLKESVGSSKIKKVTNILKYVKYDSFFFGLSDKGPVYLDQSDMTNHVQVCGPSGCGKTASCLFPFSMQAIKSNIPLIFIDGKGDAGLVKDFLLANKEVFIFNPLRPGFSHSYNPLCSSSDPTELMNLIAVGLDLNAPGEAKVYTDIQKKYLSTLLGLLVSTGEKFSFEDILEFTDYDVCRDMVYSIAKSKFHIEDMKRFLSKIKHNELIGLSVIIDQLFTSDSGVSSIINTYDPDIDIKSIMFGNKLAFFSFSAGKKSQTNEALAKMLLADIFNAVGERHTMGSNSFILIILDEFGQYVPDSFDKFISTCRGANVGVVLSHQSNAQLNDKYGSDRLARIVRENTATKVIFRQSEEASFWSETFGTKTAFKHTQQTEEGIFDTEKVSSMGTIREVDEFIVHPNTIRKLDTGQAIIKSKHRSPQVVSFGLWPIDNNNELVLTPREKTKSEGLNLRKRRLE